MKIDNALRCQIERATVRATLQWLNAHGWRVWAVDYDETASGPTVAKTDDDVMAMVFNLDECNVYAAPAALVDTLRGHVAAQASAKAEPAETVAQRKQAIREAKRAVRRASHSILLVLGNTFDTVSDYRYADGDADGFAAMMDKQHEEWERWQDDPAYLLRVLTQADRIALLCRLHRDATDERAEGGAKLPVLFIGKGGAPRYLGHAPSLPGAEMVLALHKLSAERVSLVEVDSAGWSQRCYIAHA